MENIPTSLARSVLIPLALAVETPAAHSGIHKKIIGSGTYNNLGIITLII